MKNSEQEYCYTLAFLLEREGGSKRGRDRGHVREHVRQIADFFWGGEGDFLK